MEKLDENIWTVAAPLSFFGIELGTRMTVVRLEDGGLWLHSPVEMTDELEARVAELGEVAHVVAPSRFHHLYAGEWAEAFPEATLWGAPGLPEKRTDLEFDAVLTEDSPPWGDELEQMPIEGSKILREVVFYHRASRTLITSDLFINEEDPPGLITKAYLWINGVLGEPGLSKILKTAYDDEEAARRSFERLLDWEFRRIVVAHGEVVEEDARAVLRRVIDEAF